MSLSIYIQRQLRVSASHVMPRAPRRPAAHSPRPSRVPVRALCLACAFGLLAAVSPRPDRFDPRGPELTGDPSLAGRVVFETIGPLRFPMGRSLGSFRPPFLLSLNCLLHAPPTDRVRAVDSRPVHGWPMSGLFHPAHQVVASSEVRAVRHRRVIVLLEPFARSQSLRALVARTKVVIEAGERHKTSLEEAPWLPESS